MNYQGHFADGHSAARRPVRVMLGNEGLRIYDAGGALLQDWPYKGLRLLEEVYGNHPVRLHHKRGGDATLTVEDPRVVAEAERLSGKRLGSHPLLRPGLLITASTGVILVVLVIMLVVGLPRLAGPLAALVPPAWEQALGERVVRQLTAEQGMCEAPAGVAALRALTGRITASADAPFPLIVRVTTVPGVNAFAAPGGQIVILQGLLDTAESAEEVAGVLAHEAAHSLERHPMRGLLRVVGLQLLFGALTGDMGTLDSAAGRFGQLLVLFSYTRADELAADRIGTSLLNRANIRGDGLRRFFERLGQKQAGKPGLPTLLSSHPLFEERMAQLDALATGKEAAMSAGDWAALKAICG